MIRIATRNSALAKTQASQVAALLGESELVEVSSDGGVGDKGRFVRGVERALLEGEAEIGVHSAKDLPAEMPEGLAIAAVPVREDAADVWIGAGEPSGGQHERDTSGSGGRLSDVDRDAGALSPLDRVPEGARVGTASLRRRAQLLAARPDLDVVELHGNVDTRLRKLAEGELDAIVLAAAGLRRLGREKEVSFTLPAEVMTPAAGQGALVLQARTAGNEGGGAPEAEEAASAAASIGDERALWELTAERAVVALLDATCATPIGVHARIGNDEVRTGGARSGDAATGGGAGEPRSAPDSRTAADLTVGKSHTFSATPGESDSQATVNPERGEPRTADDPDRAGALVIQAFVGLPDGSEWIRDRVEGDAEEPAAAGALLAERLLGAGAGEILDRAEAWVGGHA